mmetsp:Transcript_423/g.1175  ORF Transcript_423/g.1175 Transcript_423/m.1175 type:complete len:437 (-) Transcript_423:57-1367(-)|eukprot:CAMPEP_0198132350 /NCGR_PEP_ID=MMETSP1442-20131203/58134_1 /TAXON_ID= /ORGANISM="Craspedostauros australis, Strain CCMP3328" /LENGTH=436 /DNA_ID=CAMNT_0043793337 /DNA_START=100 /DNA_END=1410 /DNA_ORIENTATION=-
MTANTNMKTSGGAIGRFLTMLCVLASVSCAGAAMQEEREQQRLAAGATPKSRRCKTERLREDHPVLCRMLDRVEDEPQELADEIHQWASEHRLLVKGPDASSTLQTMPSIPQDGQLPVVFAHGMGDSCFNSGMQSITKHASDLLGGVYSTCIPTAKTQSKDTSNGFFLNMDASVDVFAKAVQSDPNLKNGFHGIGFSQGCNVLRGYIARYNDPPVHTFLSVNGVNAGEGVVPSCRPNTDGAKLRGSSDRLSGGSFCDLLMEQASKAAYTDWTQQHNFQANYWRDPRASEKEMYKKYSQLARWNNEGNAFNQTFNDNWAKTSKFVWVLAKQDTMVWPKEGEHWGAPDPADPFKNVLPMEQTEWYIKDLFGLRTADEAGKNFFEDFDADHLQFTMVDFDRWVTTYLVPSTAADSDSVGNGGNTVAVDVLDTRTAAAMK